MNAAVRITLVVVAVLLPWQVVNGQTSFAEPNWDRALAIESTQTIDSGGVLNALYLSARSGQSKQLLDALRAIELNDDWPVPGREYIIWSFALGLADVEYNSTGPEILDYLAAYKPQTLVAHDDRSDVGVPLFNIPAAAMGTRNSWARQQATVRAEILIQKDPVASVSFFLQASPVERRGFIDAMDFIASEQLLRLGRSALERLDEQASLTAIAGKSALILGDQNMLLQTIALGDGPGLQPILRAASMNLNAESNKKLLLQTIRISPARKSGLAIALLAPDLLGDTEVRNAMFAMLGNRDLGAAAALVLGSSADADINDRLRKLAAEKNGLASKRATLATDSGIEARDEIQ